MLPIAADTAYRSKRNSNKNDNLRQYLQRLVVCGIGIVCRLRVTAWRACAAKYLPNIAARCFAHYRRLFQTSLNTDSTSASNQRLCCRKPNRSNGITSMTPSYPAAGTKTSPLCHLLKSSRLIANYRIYRAMLAQSAVMRQ